MDNKALNSVALRYNAVFVDIDRKAIDLQAHITEDISAFLLELSESGYVVEEELLRALNTVIGHNVSAKDSVENNNGAILQEITEVIDTALGTKLNWAPLVKGWDVPTGESWIDHCLTFYANYFGNSSLGTVLQCGHFIPEGTFPLERYNGCPFCGTPFVTTDFVYKGQGRKKKPLRLMTRQDLMELLHSLMASTLPPDASQVESLKTLIDVFGVDENPVIPMKETRMVVVDALIAKAESAAGADDVKARIEEAGRILSSPADILRYLWYKKTGKLQILKPKTLVKHAGKLNAHMWQPADRSVEAKVVMKNNLRLKYSRKMCAIAALWLNSLDMDAEQACEIMHPNRGMWVRMIRALRLGEYSRKSGYGKLAEILDTFYKSDYHVWRGEIDRCLGINCGCVDYDKAFDLLRQRPGAFARSLFSVMLRVGMQRTLDEFRKVMDRVPPRLLLSLGNAAELFFCPASTVRIARPLTGGTKVIPHNSKLVNFRPEQLEEMVKAVNGLYREVMFDRFRKEADSVGGRRIFIDPLLFDVPVSVGDRSSTVQDASAALQGTRFKVEGNAVRLFMQWGKGLPAMHLDMDLSVAVCYADGHSDKCAYFNLTLPGAKHSGDIRSIPNQVGAAEYVELDMAALKDSGAKYAVFTCNAYSHGAISPNLMVGWMNSENPMSISEKTGVAYDPSTVQHIVRISEANLSKGLVFGVLDVGLGEIVWLEMPFTAQTVGGLDTAAVESLMKRLRNKISVGELLSLKAEAQKLIRTDSAEQADVNLCYTYNWALDASAVGRLLNSGR